MDYSPEQRQQISEEARGRRVKSLQWEPDGGGYWVMTFDDGAEICFRFMAELAR